MTEEQRMGRLERNGIDRETAIASIEQHIEQHGVFVPRGAGKSLSGALSGIGQRFAEEGGGTVSVHLANGEVHVIQASLD